MKPKLAALLACLLMLTGCAGLSRQKDSYTFYYLWEDYAQQMSRILASERRSIPDAPADLEQLLGLYLLGPTQEGLRSPLPASVQILEASQQEDTIFLELSGTQDLSDASFTLAGACLALTCLDITDAVSVTIGDQDRSVTMSSDTLTLFDLGTPAATEEPE